MGMIRDVLLQLFFVFKVSDSYHCSQSSYQVSGQ